MDRCRELGIRVPDYRVVAGGDALIAAAIDLGYPDRELCMKPVVAAGSRGFHVLSAHVDRRSLLLDARPGPVPLSIDAAAAALGDDPTELLVMELVTGAELELNPRISTIVYQEDLDLAWLGVQAALGRLDAADAAAAMARLRPGRIAIRYFDQVEFDPA